jgi:hypothetical protein
MTRSSPDWTRDPLERARWLDGEGTAEERASRGDDLARDPEARRRVEADGAFLAVFAKAGDERPEPSELLEARVRRALVADREAGFPSPVRRVPARVVRRVSFAAVGVLAAGLLVWFSIGAAPTSEAGRREVLLAADAYRSAARGDLPAGAVPAGCEGRADPRSFPPVKAGELSLTACGSEGAGEAERHVAVLTGAERPGDARGLVVVPWDGKSTSTDVGWTRVGDVVVFDVTIAGARYYLATKWSSVAGTASCAACHGPARAEHPTRNPHEFIERTPVVVR